MGEAVEYVTQKCAPYAAIVQIAPISTPFTKRMLRAIEPRCREGTKLMNVQIGEKAPNPSDSAEATTVQEERTFAAVVEALAEQETLQPNSQVKPAKQAVA